MKTKFGACTEIDFAPPVLLRNKHLQTILPKFFLRTADIEYLNERVTTPDGDFVDLSWALTESMQAIVVIFHGLEGSAQSHYVRDVVETLHKHNYGAVVMHFRGCSNEANLRAISYHSGATFDPEFIVPLVKQRYPSLPFFALGYSLGANMLVNLLAKRPDLGIDAAVCIAAPLNLRASSEVIDSGFSRVYQWYLMKSMKQKALAKFDIIKPHISVDRNEIANMRSFREFDEALTSLLHGFSGADDYYHKCSGLGVLEQITTPCLIVHATDDPFMDDRVMPQSSSLNQYVAYEYSKYGGHVGFLQHMFGGDKTWLPIRVSSFFNERMATV